MSSSEFSNFLFGESLRVFGPRSMKLWVFLVALFFASPLVQVSRCLSEDLDSDADVDTSGYFVNGSTLLGILNEDADNAEPFNHARKLLGVRSMDIGPSVVETVCVFPENNGRTFMAGKESELLVGLRNNGESKLVIIAIICNIHRPTDHRHIVQKLKPQAFVNIGVPPSATGTFPYVFVVSNTLQAGRYFDLVGTVYYIMDHKPSQSTFFNGTIEIVEIHGTIRVRTIILIVLGVSFIFFLWLGCVKLNQQLSDKKKAKKAQEEADMRELLAPQGTTTTAVAESSSTKNKKSKKKK